MNLMSAFISLFWGAKPVRMRLNLCLLNFLKLYAGVCTPLTSAAEDSEGAVKEISLLSLLTCFSKASRVTENRVGGCFSITPLTTPYVRIRIRRFQFE